MWVWEVVSGIGFAEPHVMKYPGDDIADRLLNFAVRCLAVVEELPANKQGRHVGDQLFRSATSGGANYEEARGAGSRADFVHRLRLTGKEVREARFWLRIIATAGWLDWLDELIDEARQLAAILAASAGKANT